MSERGSSKSRKSPASKALASKALAPKALASKQPTPRAAALKRAAPASKKTPAAAPRKNKTPAKRAASNDRASALDPPALLARVVMLEGERERLLAELAKAESRIRVLEEGRDQVLNRIDWVIDSLKSLIESEQ